MAWSKAVALLLGLLNKVAESWRTHQLKKAGRDEAISEYQGQALENIRRAGRARIDPDVLRDPDNRDAR